MPRGFPRQLIESPAVKDPPVSDDNGDGEMLAVWWYLNSLCDEFLEDHAPEILVGDATDEQLADDFKRWFDAFIENSDDLKRVDFLGSLELVVKMYSLGEDFTTKEME